jgi:hypothetical protein
MKRWPLLYVSLLASCGRALSPESVCEAGRVVDCPCPGGEQGVQACADDGSHWEACECPDDEWSSGTSSTHTTYTSGDSGSWGTTSEEGDTTGAPEDCPFPELSVAAVGYAGDGFHVFFDVGLESDPPYYCFTTGSELYLDSRIDFSIPGNPAVVVSMPDAYLEQPANLEIQPIRGDDETGVMLAFGDSLQGAELSPNLSDILQDNPVLEGHVKLCNMLGECDELDFTLAP